MPILALDHVDKFFGADQILNKVSFGVEREEHVALVGSNGAGKSTILRILAGLEEPDGGRVTRVHNLRLAYLPQDPEFSDLDTLYDVMLGAFQPALEAREQLRSIESEMAKGDFTPALVARYGQLQSEVEHAGYDFHRLIDSVLTGLELPPDTWHQSVELLSGGQRTRANLGRTLLQDADILLLDEPTNHLDIAAVGWLESYLHDLKRAFLIVAHDRYLLDRVTHRTLELTQRNVTSYDAPYSRYLDLRAERMERQRLEFKAQQRHIAQTEAFVQRYGAGQRSKEARGRQKRLDRLDRIAPPQLDAQVHFTLAPAGRTGDMVLEARHLVVGYTSKPLVHLPGTVTVRRGEHIAIIGPNGSGKTTLLRTLVGDLPPVKGTVRWGTNTSTGYYSQSLQQLDETKTVLEEVTQTRSMSEEEGRTFLGQFLFSGDEVFKSISTLSGGERSRVALAKLILASPSVLVLDEPTNHLDIASRDALQGVLSGFAGTVLFVSHDRYLIDALAHNLWAVENGQLVRYDGNYSEYAAGQALPLDSSNAVTVQSEQDVWTSPEERLQQLESEVRDLAQRIGESGRTAPTQQLREMIDHFENIQKKIREVQHAWLRQLKRTTRVSSD